MSKLPWPTKEAQPFGVSIALDTDEIRAFTNVVRLTVYPVALEGSASLAAPQGATLPKRPDLGDMARNRYPEGDVKPL
jgi:hypothetical protein